MKVFCNVLLAVLLAGSALALANEGLVTISNDPATQTWSFVENGLPVLDYHFGVVPRPEGQEKTYFGKGETDFDGSYFTDCSELGGDRSDYIQPLYGFSGEPLTEDFPKDHPHHRGVWWSWCEVRQGKRLGDLWAVNKVRACPVSISDIRSDENGASLTAENVWRFDNDPNPVLNESMTITVTPTTTSDQGKSRSIDFTLTLTALADNMSIAGRQNCDYCGYGGMAVRMEATATDFALRAVHPKPDTWRGADMENVERIVAPEKYQQASWISIRGRYLLPGETTVSDSTPVTTLTMIEGTDVPLAPSNFRYYSSRNIMIAWPGFSVIPLEKGVPVTFRCRFQLQEGITTPDEEWQLWKNFNTQVPKNQKEKAVMSNSANDYWCYAGTYTRSANEAMQQAGVGASEGIYVAPWNSETGSLGEARLVAKTFSPGYLTLSANGKVLYAVEEGAPANNTANVSAWAIDAATGNLTLLNRVSTGSASPCHLTVSPNGRFLAVANYSGGDFSIFALNDDGTIGPETDRIVPDPQLGPTTDRQEKPHAHGTYYIEDVLYLVDLGCDRIYRGTLDDNGKFIPDPEMPILQAVPGSGPRHIAQLKTTPNTGEQKADDSRLVTINELDSTVSFYNLAQGNTPVLSLSTLPEKLQGKVSHTAAQVDGTNFILANTTAEIATRPGEPFVYVSNRGHDSIACYVADSKNPDAVEVFDFVPTLGINPRYIGFSPDGRFLLAANQDSGSVVVFRRDSETGRLDKTPTSISLIPWTIDLLFVPRGK